MDDELLKEAEKIVSDAYDEYKIINEAEAITKNLNDKYEDELQDLFQDTIEELYGTLINLKPIKRKMDDLGIVPKGFKDETNEVKKMMRLIDGLFELTPDIPSADIETLERIYEEGKDLDGFNITDDYKSESNGKSL